MKKAFFAFILLPLLSHSQDDLPRIDNDTLFTSSGFKVFVGMDLLLGPGALQNGDFRYITLSRKSLLGITDSSMYRKPLPKRYGGTQVRVKKFRTVGSKKAWGYAVFVVVAAGNISNYECDIENAILVGEVVVPEEFRPKAASAISPRSSPGG